MRYGRFLIACVLFVLIAPMPTTPTLAQNPLATGACGLGRYWLADGNGWDSVWMRQGESNQFFGQGAFWMQPDGSANMSVTMEGDNVFVSRVDNPNIFGTLTCEYEGTLRPDGVSIVGGAVCQLDSGTSFALSWSASIVCGTPVITWRDTAFWHRAAKGTEFSFECPPNGTAAPIWGTGIYIEGSSICTAAVHAGVITLERGGVVTILIMPGEPSYPGNTQNGITSNEFPTAGQFDASFRVVGGQALEPDIPYDTVVGVWETTLGGVVVNLLTESEGTYPSGTLTSHVYFEFEDSHTITGLWVVPVPDVLCQTEQHGSFYWGRIRWTFDETFNSFTGTYSSCDEPPGGEWNGTRID